MKKKPNTRLTLGLLIIYLILLTWIILFKFSLDFSQLDHFRSLNLIPFGESTFINGQRYIKEIILNIFVFVPVGVYITMLKPYDSLIKKIAPCFFTSLAFEMLQFIFAIGATDVTDLIGNTLGGILGIGLFYVLQKIFKDNTVKVINVLALVCTVLLGILLSLLVIANS